ncbi:MAG: CPBP family intramembrane metalloprotease [Anaerotruncus sp.]|nr:CPBP family intramembrane metalloprotease [Anaerotruncus sp.]
MEQKQLQETRNHPLELLVVAVIIGVTLFLPRLIPQGVDDEVYTLTAIGLYLGWELVVILAAFLYERRSWSSLGFRDCNFGIQLLWGIGLGALMGFLFIGIPLLAGQSPYGIVSFQPWSTQALRNEIAMDILIIGFGEELVYRGFFMQRIREHWGTIAGVVGAAVLFSLSHYPNLRSTQQLVITLAMGLILGFAMVKWKRCSIVSVALAHGIYDLLLPVVGWVIRALE